MEKIWLKNYPAGIPAEIDPDNLGCLVDVLLKSCREHSQRTAFQGEEGYLSYAELEAKSLAFASFLQQEWGLRKGARFGIMLPNILAYPVALLGALRAGLIVVNINPLYTARELSYQLKDAECHHLLVMDMFAHTVSESWTEAGLKKVMVAHLGDFSPRLKQIVFKIMLNYVLRKIKPWSLPDCIDLNEALKIGQAQTLDPVAIDKYDIAFLQYTGGTTGLSKGAELTHRNIIANLLQARAWLQPSLSSLEDSQSFIMVTALPMYHIFSLLANCLLFQYLGGKNLLILNPRDMKRFVRILKKETFHAITGVNTLFNGLLNTPGFDQIDFSHLRFALGGGTAVQEAVAERWMAKTKLPLIAAYGLTEASPAVCINPLNIHEYSHSVGFPLPSTEISIRNEQGEEVPLGEEGELCLRGPQVMRGYWHQEEETQHVFWPEGWLRTGDIVKMDEQGYVYLLERSKDIILVSGFNVYPNEVEEILAMHPGILESGVIGVPSASTGEQIKAFVVKKDPHLTVENILEHCHKNLTGYKVPKQIEFCASLPKTPVGKILRKDLRGMLTK